MLSYYRFGCWIPRGSGIGHRDELESRLAMRPARFFWIISRTDCFIHDASMSISLDSHDNLEDDKGSRRMSAGLEEILYCHKVGGTSLYHARDTYIVGH